MKKFLLSLPALIDLPFRYFHFVAGILLLLAPVLAPESRAQEPDIGASLLPDSIPVDSAAPALHLIARHTGKSVLLRWAPARPDLWLAGNRSGYRLERVALAGDGAMDMESFVPLSAELLRPVSREAFAEAYQKSQDKYIAVAAQTLFGERRAPQGSLLEQSEELNARFAYSLLAADFSASAAELLGLRFEDKTIEPNKLYVYRLSMEPDSFIQGVQVAYFTMQTHYAEEIPQVVLLEPKENENEIVLRWSRPAHEKNFSAYHIERSDDGGKTYHRLNALPHTQPLSNSLPEANRDVFLYTDSVPRNYVAYRYRVSGLTPFGDTGPPSEPVSAMGRDRTPPMPPENVQAKYLGNGQMRISWEKRTTEPDLAGFHVARSDAITGNYLPLTENNMLDRSTRVYLDRAVSESAPNYYIVVAVDTAGNGSVSLASYGMVLDTTPPRPPAGLEGSIDTNGVVRLRWRLGPEQDLLGYVVYSANQQDHTFGSVSPQFVRDTVFTDTVSLRTLTEKIYYRLKAADLNQNHSSFSAILELKKPDIIPPVEPFFRRYQVLEDGIELEWVKSPSKDVEKHILMRQTNADTFWRMVAAWTGFSQPDRYMDTLVQPGAAYRYRIIAEDDDGLRSELPAPLALRVPDRTLKPAVRNLSALAVRQPAQVRIQWVYPYAGKYKFVLYRAKNGADFATFSAMTADTLNFTDRDVQAGNTYEYTMKVFYQDGKESAFAPIAKVIVE